VTLVSGIANDECQDTARFTIDLLGNYPAITGDFDICGGEGTTLHATGGNSYLWLENGNEISANNSVYVTPTTTTTYTLVSIAADGCEVELTQEVVVSPTSSSSLTDSVCQGERYTEHGFNLPPQLAAGQFNYTLVLPNQYGCDSTVTLTLIVKPLPNTSLGRPFNHCFEDFGDAVLSVPTPNCTYHWNTGATTQGISVSSEGTYSVTATLNGCTSSGEITISDVCPFNIYLPSAISPTDNNGINDVFKLPSTKDIANFEISIFDRWGRVVFHSEDPHFEWDGNVNGKILSGRVYNYRIELKTTGAEKRIISGSVTVL
jgi:gliding motility-associated-like protein